MAEAPIPAGGLSPLLLGPIQKEDRQKTPINSDLLETTGLLVVLLGLCFVYQDNQFVKHYLYCTTNWWYKMVK